MPQKKIRRKKTLGKYIVVDPCICHGEPTFKGTRKLVRDCLEMAAQGFTVDELANRSNLPREAIVEALQQRIEFWEAGRSVKTILDWE